MGTSGSIAAQVLVPVTARCANRGLGDNFLRALVMSGVGPDQRHWGIEHRPDGQVKGENRFLGLDDVAGPALRGQCPGHGRDGSAV
jgi:hypothetical protein